MNLHNVSISKKLGGSFSALIALLVLITFLAYVCVRELRQDIQLINENRYPKTVLVHLVKDELNEQSRNMRNLLLMERAEDQRKEYDNITTSSRVIGEAVAKLDASITTPKGQEILRSLEVKRSSFLKARNDFLSKLNQEGHAEAVRALLNNVRPLQLDYMTELDNLIKYQENLMIESSTHAVNQARNDITLIIVIAAGACILAVVMAIYTTRSITRPLHEAVEIARRVADGDLTVQIQVETEEETGQMLQALKNMNAALTKIAGAVRTSADNIATASAEIAGGNLDLSGRTEDQASSLEETASAMEELTATVKHNSENARQANQLAVSASNVAAKGGAVVAQVVETMDEINTSSKRIVDIINVIDGIAFQTNILALNAAVEAARAGEQGRGFAVVATEVRNLAQRSAAAAKEIKQLIDDSVSKVASGTKLVDEAGVTMQVVVDSIQNVADIMGEITTASAEQTQGIEQINQAIAQMDETTQQNAALVEQAAAAAGAMQDEADRLVEVVSVFKISASAQPHRTRPNHQVPALALTRLDS